MLAQENQVALGGSENGAKQSNGSKDDPRGHTDGLRDGVKSSEGGGAGSGGNGGGLTRPGEGDPPKADGKSSSSKDKDSKSGSGKGGKKSKKSKTKTATDSSGKKAKGGGSSGTTASKGKSSSGPGSPTGSSKASDKKGTKSSAKDGSNPRSTKDKSKLDSAKDSSRCESSRTSRSKGRDRSRERRRSSRDRSRDNRSVSSSRSWSSRSRSYSSSRSRRRGSRSRSYSRSRSNGRDSRSRRNSRDRDRSSRRGRSRDRVRDRERDRDRSGRGDYRDRGRERWDRSRGRGYERHYEGSRYSDRERDRMGGRSAGGRGSSMSVGWNRDRSKQDLNLASLAAPKAAVPGAPGAVEGFEGTAVDEAMDGAAPVPGKKDDPKEKDVKDAKIETANTSEKVASTSGNAIPDGGSQEQHNRTSSRDDGSFKDQRERDRGSNGDSRYRGRADKDLRQGDIRRGDYDEDRRSRYGRDRQDQGRFKDGHSHHDRHRTGGKDGNQQQQDGGHHHSRYDRRGGDNSSYGRHEHSHQYRNDREHSYQHRHDKADYSQQISNHAGDNGSDKSENNNNNDTNRTDDPNRGHNRPTHQGTEDRSTDRGPGSSGPDRGDRTRTGGDRDGAWARGAPVGGVRESERWQPDKEPIEGGIGGLPDRWRPDNEMGDQRAFIGSRQEHGNVGRGGGGGGKADERWNTRGRDMGGPGGSGPRPRGRGPPPAGEEDRGRGGEGRGGGRTDPWNGPPPFIGEGYPRHEGGLPPHLGPQQQNQGAIDGGREFGREDRGRSRDDRPPAMREKRRRSRSREGGTRGADQDHAMDGGRNYRDRRENADAQAPPVMDAVGGAGTGTLGAIAGGFGHSPAKRLRGDEPPPYAGLPDDLGDLGSGNRNMSGNDRDERRPPGTRPGPPLGPGSDGRGSELRGVGPPGVQHQGREHGGLPGRGYGPSGGMHGRGAGGARGRDGGEFGRGMNDLPPREFQPRDGLGGPHGSNQQHRSGPGAAGGPFVDHPAGRGGRGVPGPGRGGPGRGVGPAGAGPWRNGPMEFQGRGRPGPGPPGGLLPPPISSVGGRGPGERGGMGPTSSGPVMDGVGIDRRDRMMGRGGGRGGLRGADDRALNGRGVGGRDGFGRGGRGGGDLYEYVGQGARGPGGRSSLFPDGPPDSRLPSDRAGNGPGGPRGPGRRSAERPVGGSDRESGSGSIGRMGGGPTGPGGMLDGRSGSGRGIPLPGRGGPRAPPGIWGPRGPPPPGHPAWNDPQFLRQQQQQNGVGVAGRGPDGRGRSSPPLPPPWAMEEGVSSAGGRRGMTDVPRTGPGAGRGFAEGQGPGAGPPGLRRPRGALVGPGPDVDQGRRDIGGGAGGRGAGQRDVGGPSSGLDDRGPPRGEGQDQYRNMREAPWQNGRGDGAGNGPRYGPGDSLPSQPPQGTPVWEPGRGGTGDESRMGPDGRMLRGNWDQRGRFPRSDSRERGWNPAVPGGGPLPRGPPGPPDGRNVGDRDNYNDHLRRPPGQSRSRSDSRSRGRMGPGWRPEGPGYGREGGPGWGLPGRGPPGMHMQGGNTGWPPSEHLQHQYGPDFRGDPRGPPPHPGMDQPNIPGNPSALENDQTHGREGQADVGQGEGDGTHGGGTSGPQEDDPTVIAVAANLAPVCVSRRLLSSSAYQELALARQAGDAVRAGLTYEDEEGDDVHDEDQDDECGPEDGVDGAAGDDGGAADGMDVDGKPPGHDVAPDPTKPIPASAATPATPATEEDDLYDDLYGGLDAATAGTGDMSTGGGSSPQKSSSNGGIDAQGGAGAGAVSGISGGISGGQSGGKGRGGSGDEDVSTRAVMNALKKLEGPMFIPTLSDGGSLYSLQNLAAAGFPSNALEFAREILATLSA